MRWSSWLILVTMLITIWLMTPAISDVMRGVNITSTDGNSTTLINPWIPIQTALTSPSFLWLIPLFIVAFAILKITTGALSDDYESYPSQRSSEEIEEEEGLREEEEPIAQITPIGSLQDLRCPKCSAPLSFRENRDLTKCGYCGSQVQRRTEEEE